MRRMLCLILVLVFCMSLAVPAFATSDDFVGSNEGGGGGGGGGTGSGGVPGDPSNPKTGDIIMTWVIIMLLALAALVAAVVIYRKKFSN